MKHCKTCTCDGMQPISDERIRQQRLFGVVPQEGCLDYRRGAYCGKPCVSGPRTDRCKEHNHR